MVGCRVLIWFYCVESKVWLVLLYWYITLFCWRIAGRDETISCYRFGGRGTFNDALTICSNTGGYLVGIDTALEKRAVTGENCNDSWAIFAFVYLRFRNINWYATAWDISLFWNHLSNVFYSKKAFRNFIFRKSDIAEGILNFLGREMLYFVGVSQKCSHNGLSNWHWFMWCLGAEKASSHDLNQWWLGIGTHLCIMPFDVL